ncbi:MAG: elongation factor P [Bdellovibrionales bacterium]
MKVDANTVRKGNVLEINGKLYVVTKNELIIPGKGNAVAQIEMKDVVTGVKMNERFRTQESVERVQLRDREMQYLFASEDGYTFMDQETYEQYEVAADVVGDQAVYLQDGMECVIQMYEEKPLSVELPAQVTLEITEADPVVKGQTASSSYKPAVLENGVRILVPPFIEAGTRVVVATADNSYVERAKD